MRVPVRTLLAGLSAAALAGCVSNEPYHLNPGEIAAYDCGGFSFTVEATMSRARVTVHDGRIYSLDSSGPGRGYVGDGVRLWVSQRAARLELPGALYNRCPRV
jgi:hypothetical protein